MITVYTLIALFYSSGSGLKHESLYITKDDCVKAANILRGKMPVRYITCLESNRVDVK